MKFCLFRAFPSPGGHCFQGSESFSLTPRYLLYRVLEPIRPYIVGTWRVRVLYDNQVLGSIQGFTDLCPCVLSGA